MSAVGAIWGAAKATDAMSHPGEFTGVRCGMGWGSFK